MAAYSRRSRGRGNAWKRIGCVLALGGGLAQHALAQHPSGVTPPRRHEAHGHSARNLPPAPAGDPVAAELALSESLLQIESGDHTAALQSLRGVEGTLADYYRGVSLAGLGRWSEAAETFRAVRGEEGVPGTIDLDLASALLRSGDARGAEAVLTEYLTEHPGDQDAQSLLRAAQGGGAAAPAGMAGGADPYAGGYAADCDSAGCAQQSVLCSPDGLPQAAPRNWNLTFLTGYEYDTNVPLAPTFSGLGSGIDREDSRWIWALFGDYRLFQNEQWTVGLIGSAFNAYQFDLNEFDLQDYMAGAYANSLVSDNWLLGVNYQFHDTLLDEEQFAADHRLVLSATYLEGEFGHTTGYYEYENIDLDAPALIPAQFRSGEINSVGVTQAVYLMQGAGRFFAGYRYDDADTDGSDFVYTGHMVTGRVEVPLGYAQSGWLVDLISDAEIRYFWQDYANVNSLDFFERPRDDERIEVRAGIQKYFDEHVSLRFDYTYVDNDSNVANLFDVQFFSYERHVFSTQLIYDF